MAPPFLDGCHGAPIRLEVVVAPPFRGGCYGDPLGLAAPLTPPLADGSYSAPFRLAVAMAPLPPGLTVAMATLSRWRLPWRPLPAGGCYSTPFRLAVIMAPPPPQADGCHGDPCLPNGSLWRPLLAGGCYGPRSDGCYGDPCCADGCHGNTQAVPARCTAPFTLRSSRCPTTACCTLRTTTPVRGGSPNLGDGEGAGGPGSPCFPFLITLMKVRR